MQVIKHEYQNLSPVFDELEQFYTLTSERVQKDKLFQPIFDETLKSIQDLFNTYANTDYDFRYTFKAQKQLDTAGFNSKNIIVCFSGGKDSIAAVLRYLKRGYNVYLYHMRHINGPLSDEWQICQEIAEQLQLPLYIDTVTVSGHHDWIEHPMKNMIIANGALNYGIREKIGTKIAFGNYYSSSVLYDNFTFCGGDDIEMWRAYEKIIQRIIPKFRMYICLKNLGTTLNTVCKNTELLNKSVSCLSRANMRQYWHEWTENKFGVKLQKHRCGRCYKCQVEYIYMADHNLQPYNEAYYNYCLNGLTRNLEKETGFKYNIETVWNSFFFYPIEKSHVSRIS